MRLRRLIVHEAPGLPDGIRIDDLADGITIVWGPNASGKSTAARILTGMLWPPDSGLDGIRAEAHWERAGEELTATLFAGHITWNPQTPPLPGPSAAPYYLLDLRSLLAASSADELFARQIAVELAGGYDLEAALTSLQVPASRRGELHKKLNDARSTLSTLERKAQKLVSEASELPELERQRQAAERAQNLIAAAERAVELATARTELAAIIAALDALPPGLDRLSGDEHQRLEKLAATFDNVRAELEEIGHEAEQAQRRLDELRFEGEIPTAEELAAWKSTARRIAEAARLQDELERQLAEARARVHEAAEGLLATPAAPGPAFPAAQMDALERAITERDTASAKVAAIEAEIQLWDSLIEEAPAGATLPALERGIEALRSWLRTPEMPPKPGWTGWAIALLGAAAAAAGGLIAGPWWSLPGAIVASAAGGWLAARLAASRAGSSANRDELTHTAAASGVAPETWDRAHVRERLAEAGDLAALLQRNEAIRRTRTAASAQLETARTQLDEAASRVEHEARALGLDPGLPSLALIEAAHRLHSWLEAREAVARLEGAIANAREKIAGDLSELEAHLAPLGVAPPDDPASAPAIVDALEQRLDRLHDAQIRAGDLERQRAAATDRLKEAEEAITELWQHLGLEPGQHLELQRRLERLPEFQRLSTEAHELRTRIRQAEQFLDTANAWPALGLDRARFTTDEARVRLEALRREADKLSPLIERITAIEHEINVARSSTALEEARTAIEAAEEALDERRRAAIDTALTRLVVETARDQVQAHRSPRVLTRAQDWFGRFTRHTFRLEVDAATGTLAATGLASGTRRKLEELSDGTRIHLLLAARLAAIEEAEGTLEPLPLWLDETFATTDRDRFEAITSALDEMATAGRQIVSFTADEGEIELWKALAISRGAEPPAVATLAPAPGPAAGTPLVVPVPSPPDIPEPGDDDPEAYARRLGVVPPSGFDPPEQWHTIYLLPDRLGDVAACVKAGLDRVGPLLEAIEAGVPVLPGDATTLVTARAALLRAVLDQWRIGRGRPLRWEDIRSSDAISATYEDTVRQLAAAHAAEPRIFLERVRELKGFRKAKAERLEKTLHARGVLDDATPLPDGVLVTRAVAAARGSWKAAGLPPDEAFAWARSFLNQISAPSGS